MCVVSNPVHCRVGNYGVWEQVVPVFNGSVASFRKVSIASLMIVSDELFDYKWNPGFSNKDFRKKLKTGCKIVLKAVENL